MTVITYTKAKTKGGIMGKLIIDGNSVFEIDEECVKKRRPSPACDVEKYLQNEPPCNSFDKNSKRISK